jgi:uncharacterized protein (DUF1810 family)
MTSLSKKRILYDFSPFKQKIKEQGRVAFDEMKSGYKVSHWMWYFFPQLESLGMSQNSKFYGIKSLDEASAFLQDDNLRKFLMLLMSCVIKNIKSNNKKIIEIFGQVDSQKFLSSMTLFYYTSKSLEHKNINYGSTSLFKFCKEYAEKELGIIDKKTMKAIGL